jgi:glycosyltransferase involved in cell wall biosynthesis
MQSAFANRQSPIVSPWLIVAAGLHFRGGMDKANAELAAYLLNHGVPVHIVAHDVDSLFLSDRRATVHQVPRPIGSLALGEFGLGRRGREVARRLRRGHPDLRVVVNGGNCAWPDINWVHYVHHAWTEIDRAAPAWFQAKHRLFSARWRRTERSAIRSARVVIANSELTRRHVIDLLGVSPERVRTVYLGCDPSWGLAHADERASARAWLEIPDDRPLVAFVGALGRDRRKGFDTLWQAWAQLCRDAAWDADLIVAGSGAEADTLAGTARAAGLAGRVRILGHTTRIRELLAAVDLLVSPVRYESYGLNVQEALCRGVPAIVSRTAGVAERYPVELHDLLLDDPDDVGALVARLRTWRGARTAWRARIEPLARQLVSYGWKDMAAAFVSAVGTSEHEAPSTEHRALSTQHPAPSTQYEAPSTEHRARSTEHPAPSTQHFSRP